MKKLTLIFCLATLLISCNNEDEPSNRDTLNGYHWILKEVNSGPFGYYNDLSIALNLYSNQYYEKYYEVDRDQKFTIDDWKMKGNIMIWSNLFFLMLYLNLRIDRSKTVNSYYMLKLVHI